MLKLCEIKKNMHNTTCVTDEETHLTYGKEWNSVDIELNQCSYDGHNTDTLYMIESAN